MAYQQGSTFAPGEYNPNAPRPAPVPPPDSDAGSIPPPPDSDAASIGEPRRPQLYDGRGPAPPWTPPLDNGRGNTGGFNAWRSPIARRDLQTFLGNPAAKPNPIRGRAYSSAPTNPVIQVQGGNRADQLRQIMRNKGRGLGRGRRFNRGFQGRLRGAYDQFLRGQAGGTPQPAPISSPDFRNQLGGAVRRPKYNPSRPPGGSGPYQGPTPGTGTIGPRTPAPLPIQEQGTAGNNVSRWNY